MQILNNFEYKWQKRYKLKLDKVLNIPDQIE